jgi:hypothetical protein
MTLAAELRRQNEEDQGMNLCLKSLITSIKNWLNTNRFNVGGFDDGRKST